MSQVLLIGLGGGFGALARHAVIQLTNTLPVSSMVGILIVNITGTFLLGFVAGLLSSHSAWPPELRVFPYAFLASYTTFSTLSLATIQSLEKGDLSIAAVNLGGSVLLGLTAAVTGMILGRTL
jgi:CrcB protein